MKTIIAALSLAALGTGASLALDGPGRTLAPSDTVVGFANDPILTAEAPGTSVERSFLPPYSGVVRFKWDVRSGDGTEVSSAVDVAHTSRCDQATSSTSFVTHACNIRVIGGMPVTVRVDPTDVNNTVSLRNVRLYYRVVNSKGESIEYELPAGPT